MILYYKEGVTNIDQTNLANYAWIIKHFEVTKYIKDASGDIVGQKIIGFGDMLLNTILYAGGGAFINAFVQCITAYLCARYKNRFSSVVYNVVIVTMIIPVIGSQAMEIQVARFLHLYDHIWGMWLMRANFLGMYFLVFHSVFKSMPDGYYEAARIDGASDWQIMCRIALPLVKFTFLSIFLIIFIEYWNDYLIPNYYLPGHKTLSLAMYQQSSGQNLTGKTKILLQSAPSLMSTALLISAPMILVFALFSKRLMGNLSVGGLKG
jgi:ABC-type glycerol-3-phosphate transport system permease component